MSQFYTAASVGSLPPSVPLQFDGDTGIATAVGNIVDVVGASANYVTASSNVLSISWFKWNEVIGSSQSISLRNAYVVTNAAQTQLTLPLTANIGDSFLITCNSDNSAGWKILQNNLQRIIQGDSTSTVGVTGSVECTPSTCTTVILTCVVTNTTFAITCCDDIENLLFT